MEQFIVLYILAAIVIFILIRTIVGRVKSQRERRRQEWRNHYMSTRSNSSTVPPPLPSRTFEQIPTQVTVAETTNSCDRRVPPSLPQKAKSSAMNTYDFPKCYIHKCRNRHGEPQLVFWDDRMQMYRCHKGHYFTGKE